MHKGFGSSAVWFSIDTSGHWSDKHVHRQTHQSTWHPSWKSGRTKLIWSVSVCVCVCVCVKSSDDGDASAGGSSSKRGADCLDDVRQCPPPSTTLYDLEAFNDPSSRPSSHLPTRHVTYLLTYSLHRLCSALHGPVTDIGLHAHAATIVLGRTEPHKFTGPAF